ncbi:Monocarboxylate transporter 12-B [Portunus trituberculatus]|uniref:Monocarboxylate transporter 12-B n=1 Tax=Portunus trituberculatus TaxID=210409 RepID=A0A5B7HF45_PORTR|nr:Monocarboxylate transporter 12-B [Portunus trituberculatus]
MKDPCYKEEFVVLSQEAVRGWDKYDKGEESSDDWLSEIDEVNAYDDKRNEVFDDGWGWVVTFASFVIYVSTTLASTFTNCFGVLFSAFLLELHTTSTKISEIFNLALALSSMFSFLAEPLVNQFGWRKVTFITSLVYSVGLASSSFATSASFFFLFAMMTSGTCILILEVIAQHTVSIYFRRRRRLATCIVTLGTCASQVLMTPFISYLQEEFSFRGATLIAAATVLNCCVASMFLHPVEWHMKGHHLYLNKNMEVPVTLSLQPNKASSAPNSFVRLLKGSMKNIQYLRSPRIIIISLVMACNTSSLVNIWAIVPFALKTQGYSSQDVALCLSVAGLCNLASRLGNGVVSCWATFTIQKLYIIGSATSAIGIIGLIRCLLFRREDIAI